VLRPRPPQDNDLPDALDDCGVGPGGERIDQRGTLLAVCAADPHLDQLVRRERAIGFGDNSIGEAGLPDLDDRFERVRASFQCGSFARCEGRHG